VTEVSLPKKKGRHEKQVEPKRRDGRRELNPPVSRGKNLRTRLGSGGEDIAETGASSMLKKERKYYLQGTRGRDSEKWNF